MKSEVVAAMESAGWPALLVEAGGSICQANGVAGKLFGFSGGGSAGELAAVWAPENATPAKDFLEQWERSPSPAMPLKFRGKAGNTLSFLVTTCMFSEAGGKYFLLQFLPELSPGGTVENGLAHKQKLECALQLARTVALDFNNALTSILGHTSLVLSQMEPHHPWRASLLEVEKSAAKAAEIANDLGTFSRQEKEARAQAAGNFNLLAQRTVEFFQQNARPEAVEWKMQLERRLFAAKFDEAKMQQALIKVMENSLQSFRETVRRITLQTRNVELDHPSQDRNVQLAPGAYVCVEITDTGRGIEPDVLPRVFEPFFTTKSGAHRGLGLAWVYGIVTNHGGGVAISSDPGAGTSVRIYLPAEKRLVRDLTVGAEDLSGKETILMVDDEDLLLTMGRTILSAYGYQVLTADSGQKAIEMLRARDNQVQLVITDLVMPSMSGRELVEHIRRTAPSIRILCTSGYIWSGSQENEAAYLQKPFTSQDLLLKVKQVLR